MRWQAASAAAVLAAMRSVPRERFLSAEVEEFAYQDAPLPIEQGQTITGETLRQAPEAGDWAAYYDGKPPDSSYTTNKIREQELARIQSQQYEQQFGLPQGDTSTWRGCPSWWRCRR